MKDDKQHLINDRNSFTGCGSTIWQRIKQLYLDNIADLKILLCFSAPLIATGLLDLAPFIVTAIFCGHLGKIELDVYMLSSSFTSITGLPIGLGLCSAFDTIISQIYGGSNLKLIGITIQRGIIILFLSCFPCWAFYVNSRNILLLLGQDPEISRLADLCVLASIPCLPAKLYYTLEQRFLQNQGIIIPQFIVSFIGNILHIITTYVLMIVFNTGLIGAIMALLITHIGYIIGLFIYIRLWKIHEETWSGWSIDCLTDWGSFLSLGIPSMLIMCSEWWCYEVSVILAGLINLVQLGGQSVIYQVLFVIYELSSAVGTAAGIKVGNCLGAGDSHQAKKFVKLSFVIAASYTTLNVSLMFGLRPQIAAVFTMTTLWAKHLLKNEEKHDANIQSKLLWEREGRLLDLKLYEVIAWSKGYMKEKRPLVDLSIKTSFIFLLELNKSLTC
ncbi:multidrug and toxin extrusion protein 1-like [Bombina bombina]|uniref:multidrug and toxin extrusion protein 1-like n=1 Tax=Bombina bombina TaxID=8345 RepID=UPI00235A7D5E|nr:multidrug and toxin extrusion protein 1-like [Bombina bombina]